MYKSGIGYNEIRAVQSQNMTHRFNDRLYGIRINVVQVSFFSKEREVYSHSIRSS